MLAPLRYTTPDYQTRLNVPPSISTMVRHASKAGDGTTSTDPAALQQKADDANAISRLEV